jgi:lipid-A-disaccharide synthase
MTASHLKICISAGEVSGDRHLSKVIAALKASVPTCEIRGMAGPESEVAGAVLDVNCYKTGATMGFAELLRSGGRILSSLRVMKALIRSWRPDVVLLVDYPDFNMRLAKVARAVGCRVLYYIPPKVWAWRSGRVATINECVDRVAAIFPFEPAFYEERGFARASYVGHPLGDMVEDVAGKERDNVLLMLPGSRRFEVEKILPSMVRVFERLRGKRPTLRGRVVVAPNMSNDLIDGLLSQAVSGDTIKALEISRGEPLAEMKNARAGILKSGTCNLEGAVAGLPFVSVYSGSWITKVIASALVPLKEYSPVNVLRSGTVREVFGVTIDEDLLERAVEEVLDDGPGRTLVIEGLTDVRSALRLADESFSGSSVPQRVAELVVSMAEENRQR